MIIDQRETIDDPETIDVVVKNSGSSDMPIGGSVAWDGLYRKSWVKQGGEVGKSIFAGVVFDKIIPVGQYGKIRTYGFIPTLVDTSTGAAFIGYNLRPMDNSYNTFVLGANVGLPAFLQAAEDWLVGTVLLKWCFVRAM